MSLSCKFEPRFDKHLYVWAGLPLLRQLLQDIVPVGVLELLHLVAVILRGRVAASLLERLFDFVFAKGVSDSLFGSCIASVFGKLKLQPCGSRAVQPSDVT